MTDSPPSHPPEHEPDRLGRLSLRLSAVSVGLISAVVVGSVWEVRHTDWGSWLVPAVVSVGFAAGIGGAAMAGVAMGRGERRTVLWVPVGVGAVCAFLLVGELLLWE